MHRLGWVRFVPFWAWLAALAVVAGTLAFVDAVELSMPERFVAAMFSLAVVFVFQTGRARMNRE